MNDTESPISSWGEDDLNKVMVQVLFQTAIQMSTVDGLDENVQAGLDEFINSATQQIKEWTGHDDNENDENDNDNENDDNENDEGYNNETEGDMLSPGRVARLSDDRPQPNLNLNQLDPNKNPN